MKILKKDLFSDFIPCLKPGALLTLDIFSGPQLRATNWIIFDQYIIRYQESRTCPKGGPILLFSFKMILNRGIPKKRDYIVFQGNKGYLVLLNLILIWGGLSNRGTGHFLNRPRG